MSLTMLSRPKFKTGVGREVMAGEWPGDLDQQVAAWELWVR